MAVDEALLETVADDQVPTLRIYRWDRPTLSLGYFQSYSDRQSHQPSRDAEVVRRLSGGGAILHDQEITYSLVLPRTQPLAADTHRLYDTVHQAILNWLFELITSEDITGKLALCESQQKTVQQQEPFLCFQRRSSGDVLFVNENLGCDNHKIVGSAQRRRRGGVLQHGSILWAASQTAPELPGFANLTDVKQSLIDAAKSLPMAVMSALQLVGEQERISERIRSNAEEYRDRRYKLPAWTERR